MPALGMAQETGKLIAWLKQEGDQVVQGETIMEVETDKATVEIDAPASGVLAGITAKPGENVPVGQGIGWILDPGEALSDIPIESSPFPSPGSTAQPDMESPQQSAPVQASPVATRIAMQHNLDLAQVKPDGGRVGKADVLAYLAEHKAGSSPARLTPASPKARRLARERDLDLSTLPGSGPEGAVLAEDVLYYKLSVDVEATPMTVSNAWRAMAERMTQSWTSVPHFFLIREVDAGRLVAWLDAVRARGSEKLTYTDLLVKLTGVALRSHPRLNAQWDAGSITAHREINIGLAVAVEDGLIVPVIHAADQLSLEQIADRRAEIIARAGAGRLKPGDLQGGTFTITNLGMYKVDAFNAIINPPQAAILAVGRIADRVVPVQGQAAIRPMLTLSLSCDHRVVDGARGAQFLDKLAALIEEPLLLLE